MYDQVQRMNIYGCYYEEDVTYIIISYIKFLVASNNNNNCVCMYVCICESLGGVLYAEANGTHLYTKHIYIRVVFQDGYRQQQIKMSTTFHYFHI